MTNSLVELGFGVAVFEAAAPAVGRASGVSSISAPLPQAITDRETRAIANSGNRPI